MAILEGNEKDSTVLDNIPLGLYYYYINKNKLDEANYLGYAPTIESITFNPFIDETDLTLFKNNFDIDRYGKPSGNIPKCYRIASNNAINKLLGEIKLFPLKSELSNDEIKLYIYPFRYFLITDYINPPLLIKPELVFNKGSNDNKIRIKVLTAPVSQEGKYNIYVENYKKDNKGNLEGSINNTSLMLPVSSSAYAQFLATSSTSFNQGVINSLLENDVSLRQGVESNKLDYTQSMTNNALSGIGNLFSLNFGGLGGNIANALFGTASYNMNNSHLQENAGLKENNIVSMKNAKISDMLNTPKALKTCGNDTIFNLSNSRSKIDIIEYGLTDQNRDRLLDYFNRYGYSLNRYFRLYMNNRKYFTFIKTVVCNVTGENIPHKHLEEIKQIFNSGITFWNMKNNPEIGNYFVNNEEV